MRIRILLSLVIFSFGAIAEQANSEITVETQERAKIIESFSQPSTAVTETTVEIDDKMKIMFSAQKIRYVKNPCAGVHGYNFNRTRGFGFEDGLVKKYSLTGNSNYESVKYSSLGDFFNRRRVCQPALKNLPRLNLEVSSLEIW